MKGPKTTLKQVQRAAADVATASRLYGERSQDYLNAMVRWADAVNAYADQNPGKKLPANPFRQ